MLEGTVFAGGMTGLGLLWAASFGALIAIYVGGALILERLAARHPERKIQNRKSASRARDIRQSVVSLVSIAFYVAAGLWLQANGWTLFDPWALSWWSVPVALVLSLVLYDAWFYWLHRVMHTRALYRFHRQHHQSVTPTPWSCNNDTLVGGLVEQGYFLIAPLVTPIPAAVLIAHKLWDQATCMVSHSGHEFFAHPTARAPWPGLCTTFHDQHHSNFRCNYGNTFSLWDRWMGTLHPDYDATVERFERMDGRTHPAE